MVEIIIIIIMAFRKKRVLKVINRKRCDEVYSPPINLACGKEANHGLESAYSES